LLDLPDVHAEVLSLIQLVSESPHNLNDGGCKVGDFGFVLQGSFEVGVGLHFHEHEAVAVEEIQTGPFVLGVDQCLTHFLALLLRVPLLHHFDHLLDVALEDAELLVEVGEGHPHMVAILAHSDCVEDPQVPDLVVAHAFHEGEGELGLVGLDAPDEVDV
jgi:hypothetical protein